MWKVLKAVTILCTICPGLQRKNTPFYFSRRKKIQFFFSLTLWQRKKKLYLGFWQEELFVTFKNWYFSGSKKTTVLSSIQISLMRDWIPIWCWSFYFRPRSITRRCVVTFKTPTQGGVWNILHPVVGECNFDSYLHPPPLFLIPPPQSWNPREHRVCNN